MRQTLGLKLLSKRSERSIGQTMPTMPVLPLDLFSRGTKARDTIFRYTQPDFYIHNYPEIIDLKLSAKPETYDVVGFTNCRSEATTRKISLVDKLGLKLQHRRYCL